jgi:hypothetical protein
MTGKEIIAVGSKFQMKCAGGGHYFDAGRSVGYADDQTIVPEGERIKRSKQLPLDDDDRTASLHRAFGASDAEPGHRAKKLAFMGVLLLVSVVLAAVVCITCSGNFVNH